MICVLGYKLKIDMKKLISILLFPFTLLSFGAAGQVKSKAYSTLLNTLLSHSVQEISVQEASVLVENTIFLDAREPHEYGVSHIENALPVGYDDFEISSLTNVEKNSPIIVYCSVGYRSEKVAEKLIEHGYTNVSNLYGGIFEWKNQGFEVVDKNSSTERVHAFNKAWGIWLKKGEKVY
jgi:rhodanese-related sulfurtransferase